MRNALLALILALSIMPLTSAEAETLPCSGFDEPTPLVEKQVLAKAVYKSLRKDNIVSGNELISALRKISSSKCPCLQAAAERANAGRGDGPLQIVMILRGADGLDERWEFDPSLSDTQIVQIVQNRFTGKRWLPWQ